MNDLNERIAEWAGLECHCQRTILWKGTPEEITNRYWGSCPRHSNGGNPPDYSRDEVAVGLLQVIVSRGWNFSLSDYYRCSWFVCLTRVSDEFYIQTNECTTIASAICAAVEKIMEVEK